MVRFKKHSLSRTNESQSRRVAQARHNCIIAVDERRGNSLRYTAVDSLPALPKSSDRTGRPPNYLNCMHDIARFRATADAAVQCNFSLAKRTRLLHYALWTVSCPSTHGQIYLVPSMVRSQHQVTAGTANMSRLVSLQGYAVAHSCQRFRMGQ